jgi:integrase/recombinase XerD
MQVKWERYPRTAAFELTRRWLTIQLNLGLAANTIDAYARALEDYLTFSRRQSMSVALAGRDHVAAYVHDLSSRPNPRVRNNTTLGSNAGLANATLQQRLTAVRLFYDYLMEEGVRPHNPVGRGRYTPGKGFAGARERGLIPRYTKLPWVPNDEQWRHILQAAKRQSLRNRLMLALAYDSALRREGLCGLEANDIDPAFQTIRVRAENTKNPSAGSSLIRRWPVNCWQAICAIAARSATTADTSLFLSLVATGEGLSPFGVGRRSCRKSEDKAAFRN